MQKYISEKKYIKTCTTLFVKLLPQELHWVSLYNFKSKVIHSCYQQIYAQGSRPIIHHSCYYNLSHCLAMCIRNAHMAHTVSMQLPIMYSKLYNQASTIKPTFFVMRKWKTKKSYIFEWGFKQFYHTRTISSNRRFIKSFGLDVNNKQ